MTKMVLRFSLLDAKKQECTHAKQSARIPVHVAVAPPPISEMKLRKLRRIQLGLHAKYRKVGLNYLGNDARPALNLD